MSGEWCAYSARLRHREDVDHSDRVVVYELAQHEAHHLHRHARATVLQHLLTNRHSHSSIVHLVRRSSELAYTLYVHVEGYRWCRCRWQVQVVERWFRVWKYEWVAPWEERARRCEPARPCPSAQSRPPAPVPVPFKNFILCKRKYIQKWNRDLILAHNFPREEINIERNAVNWLQKTYLRTHHGKAQ